MIHQITFALVLPLVIALGCTRAISAETLPFQEQNTLTEKCKANPESKRSSSGVLDYAMIYNNLPEPQMVAPGECVPFNQNGCFAYRSQIKHDVDISPTIVTFQSQGIFMARYVLTIDKKYMYPSVTFTLALNGKPIPGSDRSAQTLSNSEFITLTGDAIFKAQAGDRLTVANAGVYGPGLYHAMLNTAYPSSSVASLYIQKLSN